MSDYVGDGLGWSCGRMVPPVALMSSRDTATTTWRSPGDARIVPGPSVRASRSATVTARSFAGISRRRGLPIGTAWGTMDPLAPPAPAPLAAPMESVDRSGESPLVTVHLKNHSCAASGSEAFFNLSQHGGRRGTAISRSSSCVSAISRSSYRLHSIAPPTPPTIPATHTSLGRRASNALSGRRVGRSYSVAPADWSSSAMPGARVVGRRAQRLQLPSLPVQQQPPTPREHKLSHPQSQQYYHQNILIHQQPEKQPASCGVLDEVNQNAENDNATSLPPALPPARPQPPTPPPLPLKWHRTAAPSTSGCRCQPCSVGGLVARAYKAVLKAASTCMLRKYMGEFDLMTANGHPTPSPTPPNGLPSDMNPAPKIVVALYDYNATERGDLSLRKNEEFEVLEQDQEHWWKMRNRQTGMEGFAPSNYVRELGTPDIQQYDWYLGDATRQRAEVFLMQQEREGCFVVRNSTTNSGVYTLSVYTKQSHPQVKHYHIKKDPEGNYYLSQNIKCKTIPELIYRHQHNPGGICARLRPPTLGRTAPATAGLSHDKWEIDPSELNLLEELGSGQFGVVRHGKLKSLDVAVKMMKEGTMSEDEFIEEAKVMTKLRHGNLVQLYGVCSRQRPIYIVTEYLRYGSLLQYLRNKERILLNNTDVLLDMCLQVCSGMAYLEKQKFIHRDLAARNCLVGAHNEIKVGDFGLARYVVDDEYTGSGGAKFPIKWAAPEVLNFMRFSSKSDVWAFGVLMWEVFTCGKMPYGRMKNAEVVDMVQHGRVLEKPRFCPSDVYNVMQQCWNANAENRPSFNEILRMFQDE